MNDNRGIAGVNVGHMWNEPEILHEELEAILDLVREGHVKPRIAGVDSFEQAADAHRLIEERKNIGKVILVP